MMNAPQRVRMATNPSCNKDHRVFDGYPRKL
jgi:hypothetical protein